MLQEQGPPLLVWVRIWMKEKGVEDYLRVNRLTQLMESNLELRQGASIGEMLTLDMTP